MSASLPSDEVAEDYKNSLDDLVSNDRYQISNLTLIAKENIEHAEAISRVLQNHIQRAPPARKLPALYVLDSVVKNVGSPYTVYFGRNLYQTFMHAYSQVDGVVRRKLEEMLKTWREPVPGSLSTTPVFPFASTQTIVDNLNKLRGSSNTPVQRYQQPSTPAMRVASAQPYHQAPTPTQNLVQYPHGGHNTPQPPTIHVQQYNQIPTTQTTHQHNNTQIPSQYQQFLHVDPPTPTYEASQVVPESSSSSAVDVHKLHANIDDLTTDAKIECATHPMDAGARQKLTTLQTLKEILDSGTASESDLVDIRNSIMQEMAKKLATIHQPQALTAQQWHGSATNMFQMIPQQQHNAQLPSTKPAFINSTNLAELLRATSKHTQAPPLAYSNIINSLPSKVATPPPSNIATAPIGELPLLAQLRASGLLSAASTPSRGMNSPLISLGVGKNEIALTSAAIKITRPQLVTTFFNTRPNQCGTCGRRFTSDDVGRERKSKHLDWHFKTKARMVEAEKRGQNRSWYVDEREWIASREYDDDAESAEATTNGFSPSSANKKKTEDFVRAPTDPTLRSLPCPIDQEPFRSEWSEDVQDFIWKDAVIVGARYYHASCYKEIMKHRDKDAGNLTPVGAGLRTSTPDSILGKRKAEDPLVNLKSKVKVEI